MSKKKKRKQKKPRNLITLGMILTRKGAPMRDKRERRKNGRNRQKDALPILEDDE